MDASLRDRRPWKTSNQARLAAQNKQLRLVLEFRLKRSFTSKEAAYLLRNFDIEPTQLYRDPIQLGELLRVTVEEELYLKTTTGRFPGSIYPAGFSKPETTARRRKYDAPKRAKEQRQRRLIIRARRTAAAHTGCRSGALLALLGPKWVSLKQLMNALRRAPAYRLADESGFLSGNSLRQAILRVLKGPLLRDKVACALRKEKHGLPMHLYRLK